MTQYVFYNIEIMSIILITDSNGIEIINDFLI